MRHRTRAGVVGLVVGLMAVTVGAQPTGRVRAQEQMTTVAYFGAGPATVVAGTSAATFTLSCKVFIGPKVPGTSSNTQAQTVNADPVSTTTYTSNGTFDCSDVGGETANGTQCAEQVSNDNAVANTARGYGCQVQDTSVHIDGTWTGSRKIVTQNGQTVADTSNWNCVPTSGMAVFQYNPAPGSQNKYQPPSFPIAIDSTKTTPNPNTSVTTETHDLQINGALEAEDFGLLQTGIYNTQQVTSFVCFLTTVGRSDTEYPFTAASSGDWVGIVNGTAVTP